MVSSDRKVAALEDLKMMTLVSWVLPWVEFVGLVLVGQVLLGLPVTGAKTSRPSLVTMALPLSATSAPSTSLLNWSTQE